MLRISLAAAVTAAALVFAGAVPAQSNATKLTGTVGPGFTITLKDSKGKKVTSLKAGEYTITVTDKSSIHDWVLEGAGLGKGKVITSTPYKGTKSATVKLQKGKTYTYVCTPHRTVPSMKGTFKVS